jgi:hypothetical protein
MTRAFPTSRFDLAGRLSSGSFAESLATRSAAAWSRFSMGCSPGSSGRRPPRLQALDDHLLRDIGLSRADIDAEAGKPFWRG